MSAITDSDSAISGGSVRDVLADTNNLSERWERLPAPPRIGPEPTTVDWEWADGAGLDLGGEYSAIRGGRIPSSAVTS
ncbi:hypothetical protein GCM10009654_11060 [Streptomyces hebeiensis]|uniref:Uncharacterized protein n=1 Tax=Streptomyces hebeiensis TaxID=229486 RepID=A0ABP4F8B5_9ACTN